MDDDLGRREAIRSASIAELTLRIASPRPYCPVAFQCQAMVRAARNCHHSSEAADLDRRRVRGDIVAEAVGTPLPNRPVSLQGKAVDVAGGNRHHTREPAGLDWRQAIYH